MKRPSRLLWFSAALFVVALLPRLWVALYWATRPAWDGVYYDIGARSIAHGLGYVGKTGKLWCHYPVGYSAALALSYRVFGFDLRVALVSNALMGALLAVVSYRLARHWLPEGRARLAGLLVACYPGLVLYAGVLLTEVLAALLLLSSGLIAARYGHRRRGLAAAALVLGLGVLVRPQSIVCAPLLALFARRDGHALAGRKLLAAAAVASAVSLLTVLPWSLRNCVLMDGCAFVSTNAGWNLAIGSFPRATGRYAILRPGDGCHLVTGQVQQNRCWMRLGARWIAAEPRRWLGLVDNKLAHTFDHESYPVGYLAQADPARWPASRRNWWRGALSWSHRALLTLATLSLLPPPRRDRPTTLLWALAVLLVAWYAAMTLTHPFWPLALLALVAGQGAYGSCASERAPAGWWGGRLASR